MLVLPGAQGNFGFCLVLLFVVGFVEGAWFGYFSVAEGLYYFEDFGPCGERSGVLALVFVDGHEELELFVGHVALFGGLAVVGAAPARTTTAVQSEAPVHDALSPILALAALDEIRVARVRLTLAPVGHTLAAVFSTATLAGRHIICV